MPLNTPDVARLPSDICYSGVNLYSTDEEPGKRLPIFTPKTQSKGSPNAPNKRPKTNQKTDTKRRTPGTNVTASSNAKAKEPVKSPRSGHRQSKRLQNIPANNSDAEDSEDERIPTVDE